MHLRRTLTVQANVLIVLVTMTAGNSSAQGPVFTTLYEFKGGTDGTLSGGLGAPNGVIVGNNGRLYGATYAGGINSCGSYACGTVYELTPASGTPWTKRVVHEFDGADGALPDANLVFGSNGALYGTTQAGGTANNGGTVFELAPPTVPGGAWTETALYSFNGVWSAPHEPYGGVVIGPSGALYGTTSGSWCWDCGPESGGGETGGTVFTLIPPASPGGTWTQYTIFQFWPITPLGIVPLASVTFKDGSLYGTNSANFPTNGGCGAVYELTPGNPGAAWTGTAIYTFGGGCNPEGPVKEGPDGALYGMTHFGGTGCGGWAWEAVA